MRGTGSVASEGLYRRPNSARHLRSSGPGHGECRTTRRPTEAQPPARTAFPAGINGWSRLGSVPSLTAEQLENLSPTFIRFRQVEPHISVPSPGAYQKHRSTLRSKICSYVDRNSGIPLHLHPLEESKTR